MNVQGVNLTATDASGTPLTAAGNYPVNVTPAPPAQIALSGYAGSWISGVGNSLTITVQDQFGNTETGYNGTVQLSTNDGAASGGMPSHAFIPADNGVFTFPSTVILKTVGTTTTISGADTVSPAVSGTTTNIAVTPGALASFTVAGYPNPTTAGVSNNVTVTAYDAAGNLKTNYAGTVTLGSSDGGIGVQLPGAYTFQAGDNGTKQFAVPCDSRRATVDYRDGCRPSG